MKRSIAFKSTISEQEDQESLMKARPSELRMESSHILRYCVLQAHFHNYHQLQPGRNLALQFKLEKALFEIVATEQTKLK